MGATSRPASHDPHTRDRSCMPSRCGQSLVLAPRTRSPNRSRCRRSDIFGLKIPERGVSRAMARSSHRQPGRAITPPWARPWLFRRPQRIGTPRRLRQGGARAQGDDQSRCTSSMSSASRARGSHAGGTLCDRAGRENIRRDRPFDPQQRDGNAWDPPVAETTNQPDEGRLACRRAMIRERNPGVPIDDHQ